MCLDQFTGSACKVFIVEKFQQDCKRCAQIEIRRLHIYITPQNITAFDNE